MLIMLFGLTQIESVGQSSPGSSKHLAVPLVLGDLGLGTSGGNFGLKPSLLVDDAEPRGLVSGG